MTKPFKTLLGVLLKPAKYVSVSLFGVNINGLIFPSQW